MRILFDLQTLQGHARHRGLGRYSLEIASAMASRPEVSEATVLIGSGLGTRSGVSARSVLSRRMPRAKVLSFDAPWPWATGQDGSVEAHVHAEKVRDQLIRELDPDIVLVCSLFELPLTSVISVPDRGRPFTATIGYDLLPSTDPACAWPPQWAEVYEHRMQSFASSDLVLSISDYTSSEIHRYMGNAAPPVATIWGAAGEVGPGRAGGSVLLTTPAERRGVLCVGGADPRKNQISSIEAFAGLPSTLRTLHPLLIQGQRSVRQTRELLAMAAELGIGKDQIRVLGANLDEHELDSLYRGCRLVTMPSVGEGLGLPVLEAWAAGTPAIASSTTSLGEVVDDPRWTFEPFDVDRQRDLMMELLADDQQWGQAETHARGRSQFFTWDLTAERALGAILEHHPGFRDVVDWRGSDALTQPSLTTGPASPHPETPLPRLLWVCADDQCEGHEKSVAVLARQYSTTIWHVGSVDLDPRPDEFDRVIYELVAGPHLDAGLRLLLGWPGILVVHDAEELEEALRSAATLAADTQQMQYVGGGLRALLHDEGSVVNELARMALGVAATTEAAYQCLVSGPGSLPLRWVQLWEAGEESRIPAAIEQAYRRQPEAAVLAESAAHGVITCASRNRPDRPAPTLYLDVSRPRDFSGRSGIQRVTAAVARNIVRLNPGRTFLVGRAGGSIRHETSLLTEFVGIEPQVIPTIEGAHCQVLARPGDALLLTEINPDSADWHTALDDWRARGGICVQVVHDLLPIKMEDFFPSAKGWFSEWLRVFTLYADVLVCDSEASARDLRTWLLQNPPDRETKPVVTWMRLGYDLSAAEPVPHELRVRPRGKRKVLCVGTIEPRKGVDVLLDAAEQLWADNHDLEFTVVGRPGWAMPSLIQRLRDLHESEQQLTWLEDASDAELQQQYLEADLLVMASRGEGFGLPIVEALAHGVPVVARDIPVFRELLGPDGCYFTRDGALAGAILRRLSDEAPPRGVPDRLVTWSETASDLLEIIDNYRRSRGSLGPR